MSLILKEFKHKTFLFCPHGPFCGCSEEGSKDIGCSEETGMCDCKTNYRGLKCKECEKEYYKYPECKGKSNSILLIPW